MKNICNQSAQFIISTNYSGKGQKFELKNIQGTYSLRNISKYLKRFLDKHNGCLCSQKLLSLNITNNFV